MIEGKGKDGGGADTGQGKLGARTGYPGARSFVAKYEGWRAAGNLTFVEFTTICR